MDFFSFLSERKISVISGGENIYPAEVREALLQVPGVSDACVFGTADETWGYRPVAFIQADSISSEAIAHDRGGYWDCLKKIRAFMRQPVRKNMLV